MQDVTVPSERLVADAVCRDCAAPLDALEKVGRGARWRCGSCRALTPMCCRTCGAVLTEAVSHDDGFETACSRCQVTLEVGADGGPMRVDAVGAPVPDQPRARSAEARPPSGWLELTLEAPGDLPGYRAAPRPPRRQITRRAIPARPPGRLRERWPDLALLIAGSLTSAVTIAFELSPWLFFLGIAMVGAAMALEARRKIVAAAGPQPRPEVRVLADHERVRVELGAMQIDFAPGEIRRLYSEPDGRSQVRVQVELDDGSEHTLVDGLEDEDEAAWVMSQVEVALDRQLE